jgi:fatty acid desaturase
MGIADRAVWGRLFLEWPTWLMLALCYGGWLVLTAFHPVVPIWLWVPAMAVVVALHGSLQHECLHGHPTPWRSFNEALVGLPLGLVYPYRRFRALHLKHHVNSRLTDPYDDPESFYLADGDWRRLHPAMRLLLRLNATLAGRLVIGPWLAVFGFARAEWRRLRADDQGVRLAWLLHALGAGTILIWLLWVGLPFWLYMLGAAWPGLSLLMLRSYAEHRADPDVRGRTAIVEASPLWGVLFLNNNLHYVHHRWPQLAWYRLPARYARRRAQLLAENRGYLIRGYATLLRRFALRPKEPVPHPHLRRD